MKNKEKKNTNYANIKFNLNISFKYYTYFTLQCIILKKNFILKKFLFKKF